MWDTILLIVCKTGSESATIVITKTMGSILKINLLRVAVVTILLSVATVYLSVGIAGAATTPAKKATPTPPNSSTSSLKVSPVRTDITIEAGKSDVVKTYVTNITATPIVVSPIENDFIAGDEAGTPSIVLDENSYAPSHSLKRFMLPLKNVTIGVGETKQVDLTIVVPKSAQAGGYYGAVRYAPANPDGSKNVNLSSSVASLVLLTVPGPVTEDLRMTNFDLQQDGSASTNFRTPDNIELLLRFENKGNIQEAPFGQIYVQDARTKKAVYTYDFNQDTPRANILPDSARRWNIPLKNFKKFGKYTVGATFSYGASNKTIEVKKTVWIIPMTYIIAAIAALVGLILLIIFIVVALKSYKRRILRSSARYRRR